MTVPDRAGRAGGVRDDRQRRGAHAAQVGLARTGRDGLVLELLVARVRVHGVDEALLDAEALVQHRAIGARQLVVHDAFEMTVCAFGS